MTNINDEIMKRDYHHDTERHRGDAARCQDPICKTWFLGRDRVILVLDGR